MEILEQTDGRVTHFVAGLGTSGTFIGVGRRLREHNRDIRLISVQPDRRCTASKGSKHMETAIGPGIYDPLLADEDVRVSTERSHELTRRLAREEGMLAGVSSGAALGRAASIWPTRIREGVIVTVFPDSGTRYLTERFWEGRPMSAGVGTRHQHHGGGARGDPGATAWRPFPTSAAAR